MAKSSNKTQKKNFTMVDNWAVYNEQISLKALGLYAKLCSLPDNWHFSEEGLKKICKDGTTSIRSAIRELEELNLLLRFRQRNDDGTLGECVYHIASTPLTEEDKSEIIGNNEQSEITVSNNVPMLQEPILENLNLDNEDNIILNNNKRNNKENKKEKNKGIIQEAIDYLNDKTGSSFKSSSKATVKIISARLTEGFSLEEIKCVIDFKCEQWLNDERMRQYLRPSTLFSDKHFEEYLQESKNIVETRLQCTEVEFGVYQL